MPGLGVVPKPRISAGFKTVRSGGLSMPKPPATPKAGRLSPTGGRIGGVPGKTAPRVPGPANPPTIVTAKALPLKRLVSNTRRANGKFGYVTTVKKEQAVSERDYVIEKAFRLPTIPPSGNMVKIGPVKVNRRKVKNLVMDVGREMDPKRNKGARMLTRLGIPQIGEGAAALAADRGKFGYAPDVIRGLKGLRG